MSPRHRPSKARRKRGKATARVDGRATVEVPLPPGPARAARPGDPVERARPGLPTEPCAPARRDGVRLATLVAAHRSVRATPERALLRGAHDPIHRRVVPKIRPPNR